MVHVLFVCLGNICRSPMAEAVFRHKVWEAGLLDSITIDSAGTGDWHLGEKPHQGTRDILQKYKIDDSNMFARQVVSTDFSKFEYIVAMDDSNVENLKGFVGTEEPRSQVFKMLDFLPEGQAGNVPDPYFTGNFEEVYEMINTSSENLLAHIRADQNI
ncbi:low molecular weight phosphotyrosine protein phosphatase [Paenibacillus sp. N1-5-1-14]|uniref:low molecular weight protein-tyrosine-phosphatase n=1 Tax=Paenibacillus radicibacter TaxID=2972488 RepID=UPI0021596A46|nr:low molecular weight protein-tyrosine-phosphatase [Paenibacillus radicibacter]MCR8642057.1 low molecular weight phosphotyrosine protein phosphatase [Paenibacillus radicibacter]